MRKLKTDDITTAVAMPVKGGTLLHLQLAHQEAVAEALKAVIRTYSPLNMYILTGLVNSGIYPNYNITAGSVFMDGEVYLVDAANFTVTGSNVAVCSLVTTYFSGSQADGVEFSDGIVRNVHEIRKVVIAEGLAGSGMKNYVDLLRIDANIPQVNITGAGIASVTGTYPNKVVTVPDNNKVVKMGSIAIGDLNTTPTDPNTSLLSGSGNGISGYRHIFPAAMANNHYKPIVILHNNSMNSVTDFDKNYGCTIQVGQCNAADFYFAISTSATSNVQDLTVDYILISTD